MPKAIAAAVVRHIRAMATWRVRKQRSYLRVAEETERALNSCDPQLITEQIDTLRLLGSMAAEKAQAYEEYRRSLETQLRHCQRAAAVLAELTRLEGNETHQHN